MNVCTNLTHPVREVSQTPQIDAHGDSRVSTFSQVMRKSINVGRKLAIEKPIMRVTARRLQVHNGLQKLRPHFTTSTKLCPDQSGATTVAPSKNAVQHGIKQLSVHSFKLCIGSAM